MVKIKNKKQFISISITAALLISIIILLFITAEPAEELDLENTNASTDVAVETEDNPIELNAIMSLVPMGFDTNEMQTNTTYQVDIFIDATNYMIVGSDVIITFDPTYAEVSINIEDGGFDLYPIGEITDEEIKISALVNLENVITGNIKLATLNITPLTTGQTEMNIQFEPNSTTDTNVVESITSIDRLGAVTNLKLIIIK